MAHALAPHLLKRHLNAALLTNDSLVLHALVLAAQTFVILSRAEYAGTEQTVALRLEGPVVDSFGFLYFAERPRSDPLRRGNGNAD